MLHLVLCFLVWSVIFTGLFWRSIAIAKQAVSHLKHLHQIPCDKCAYFTRDYRLKCTVNPTIAMSETAIGCRDFLFDDDRNSCRSCRAIKQCGNALPKSKLSPFKRICRMSCLQVISKSIN